MTFDRAASAPGTPSSPDSGSRTPDLRRDSMGGTTAAGSSVGHGAGGKHKWTGMLKDLKHANPSFHSLKSFGSNFGVAKSTASSEAGTPTTEGDDWDEKWMSRERDREREKRRKEEKRRKKKTEAYVRFLFFFSLALDPFNNLCCRSLVMLPKSSSVKSSS